MTGDPGAGLIRALSVHLGPLSDVVVQTTPWVSATFQGTRHALWLTATLHEQTHAILDELCDLDLPMADHFVADIEVVERNAAGDAVRIGLNALTIEDR